MPSWETEVYSFADGGGGGGARQRNCRKKSLMVKVHYYSCALSSMWYDFAVCNCSTLNFLIYEENILFFFNNVETGRQAKTYIVYVQKDHGVWSVFSVRKNDG